MALAIGLIVAGGGDDDEGSERAADTTEETEQTQTAVDPSTRQIAEPIEIPPSSEADLESAAEAAGCDLESYPSEGNNHTSGDVAYGTNPPTSGDHDAIPAEDGVYIESQREENLVHSLEHGRILLQFSRDADEQTKGGLQALYDEDPEHMILTVNATGMPYEVAATAWRHLLGCPEMNDEVYGALRAFRSEYRDAGPELVP